MKKTRDICVSLGFALFLAAVALLTLFRDVEEKLYYENRLREPEPVLTGQTLLDGTYFDALERCLTDRAPGRNTLLAWQTAAEMELLRLPSVNDVVVTDGALLTYKDYETWDVGYLADRSAWMADENRALADSIEAYGGRYYYLGIPEMFSYFADKYPTYMDNRQWYLEAARRELKAAFEARGLCFIEMRDVFEAMGCPESYYFLSDHHYSYAGALVCYTSLMEKIQNDTDYKLDVLRPGENLELVTLDNHFVGSYGKKLYDLWENDDALTIGLPEEEIPFTREDEGEESEPVVFKLPESRFEDADYNVYMGGDRAETVIRTGREELPSILVYGDSYTNALETLLYWSFDEFRSIDLRYYDEMTLAEYAARWQPDIVVCIRDDTSYCDPDGNGNPMGAER
jgi:hypothetical protein